LKIPESVRREHQTTSWIPASPLDPFALFSQLTCTLRLVENLPAFAVRSCSPMIIDQVPERQL